MSRGDRPGLPCSTAARRRGTCTVDTRQGCRLPYGPAIRLYRLCGTRAGTELRCACKNSMYSVGAFCQPCVVSIEVGFVAICLEASLLVRRPLHISTYKYNIIHVADCLYIYHHPPLRRCLSISRFLLLCAPVLCVYRLKLTSRPARAISVSRPIVWLPFF